MAEVYHWQNSRDDAVLQRTARVLAAGGVVACPTETFYALAVDAGNQEALDRLMALKRRPRTKPVLVLVAHKGMVSAVAAAIPPLAERLMTAFWPGPLTLILPARSALPPPLTAGTGSIGVRQPNSRLTRRLLEIFGRPLTGTSANLSGQEPFLEAHKVQQALGAEVDVILANAPCPGGLPSTIISLLEDPPRLVRAGALPVATLQQELAGIVLAEAERRSDG